ncbi:MAG TPA: S8 family serine peptidase [Steroidobacteraceae bacterium]|nr:S8 family serine peptidase [Steroidobacteraceae bacterium]
MRSIVLTALLAIASTAFGQVGLPAVRLPGVPAVTVPGLPAEGLLPENGAAAAALGELDPRRLRELRQLRIRELLRRHRDLIEADPRGEPIVRGEVIALAPSAAALAAAEAAGFAIVRERAFTALGTRIVVLHAAGATARGLERIRALDPAGTYDFNHIYLESGEPEPATAAAPPPAAGGAALQRPAAGAALPGAAAARVGLIDSGVDAGHEVFRGLAIQQHGCAGRPVPEHHGTAVASLLVGSAGAFRGAAPGAGLYAADVFCGLATGGAVDTVADAFGWLVGERVPVINVSLVGPPDRMLEAIVANVIARGYLVVAAVGNDGPAAPPLYPAAWPGVVGVTAVDARRRLLPEAERGPQVKLAAPGADMAAARLPRGYALVRGTSFASPIVAGLLALGLRAPGQDAAAAALAALEGQAIHLGAPGLDPAWGYGLVGADLGPPPALVRAGAR